MATDLVPFGKHKGQPVIALAQDRDYCDWLLQQSWFMQRFPELHTIVVNNFGEPTETPEHNRLQLRFLDDTFRAQCTQAVFARKAPRNNWPALALSAINLPEFEVGGVDVLWTVEYVGVAIERHTRSSKNELGVLYEREKGEVYQYVSHFGLYHPKDSPEYLAWKKLEAARHKRIMEFEKRWKPYEKFTDCTESTTVLRCVTGHLKTITVECKPTLGDDYPAVLRYMKSLNLGHTAQTLVVGVYQGSGGSIEEVRIFFQRSGIVLLMVEEIEATAPLRVARSEDVRAPIHFWDTSRAPTTEIYCSHCGKDQEASTENDSTDYTCTKCRYQVVEPPTVQQAANRAAAGG